MIDITFKGKVLKTPQGKAFQVPNNSLAQAIEEEWEKDPSPHYQHKPLTALTATALDQVARQRRHLITYGLQTLSQDALLFWEDHPESLITLQNEKWQPCLDQINKNLGLHLKPTYTLSLPPITAEDQTIANDFLHQQNSFTMAGFLNLLSLTHSFTLSYLILEHLIPPEKAWENAHLHENFQRQTWGKDEEALQQEENQYQEFLATLEFLKFLASVEGR